MKRMESGQWTITSKVSAFSYNEAYLESIIDKDGKMNEHELMRSRNPETCPPRATGAWECGLNPNCSLEDIRKYTKIYAKKSVVETHIDVVYFPSECAQINA